MISRSKKLSATDVRRVFRLSDRSLPSSLFRVVVKNEGTIARFAVVVPRSVTTRAVERNSVRRVFFEALRGGAEKFPPALYVFVVRPGSLSASVEDVRKEMKKVVRV